MPDHFKRNHDSVSEMFLDKIISGGSLAYEIGRLRKTAKKYINRAGLAKNATIALNFHKASSALHADRDKNDESIGVLLKAERDLYDYVHDDLFIVAAFENYAKAVLLSKRYVVHSIRRPSSLNNKQKITPIHINTIRAKSHLPNLWFDHHTIGVNCLHKPGYMKLLGISEKAGMAIGMCRGIRNQIHFGGPNFIRYGPGLYEGLIDLTDTIMSQ